MRIKNKEIRRRRHRKDGKIKEAMREIRLKHPEKKPAPVAAKPSAPKKATAKKKAESEA